MNESERIESLWTPQTFRISTGSGEPETERGIANARLRARLMSYNMATGRTRTVDILDERGRVVETVRPMPTAEECRKQRREDFCE